MKQRGNFHSVKSLVEANTGMTEHDLICDTKNYFLDGASQAAEKIREYFKQKIYIVGDYDVDGICASAILSLVLKKAGASDVTVRLPRRFSEGYGMNPGMINEFEPGNLIVTVDNGIAAHAAIAKAKALGFEVVVTDHHLPVVKNDSIDLPDADILIDPHAVKGNTDFVDYCGAGIAYKIAENMTDDVIFLRKMLGIAAIATIADCVPLIGENRRIVKDGLRHIMFEQTRTAGISALIELMGIESMNTEKVSFSIAPALNAPGRLYDDGSLQSFELVTCENEELSHALAEKIVEDNNKRKAMSKDGETEAIAMADQQLTKPVVLYMPDLCEGLCGIVAAKLCEKYQCPAVVFSGNGETVKGSARSYGGIHLKELLDSVSEYLEGYGGHADAAGLLIQKNRISDFREALSRNMPEIAETDPEIYYDLEISTDDINQTISDLARFEPYGEGNPAPVFYVTGLHLVPRGNSHYKAFSNDTGIRLYSENAEITAFSSSNRNMVKEYEQMGYPRDIEVIGSLSTDVYKGRTKNQIIAEEIINKSIKKERKQSSLAMLLQKKALEGRRK